MLEEPPTTNPELELLNYRLRKLYGAGILDLSESGFGMKTITESTVTDFPEDPVTRKLLSEKLDPAIAKICLWHILWQIYNHMTFGCDTANKVRSEFPNPIQDGKNFPTIYGTGLIKPNDDISFNIARNPSPLVAQETRKRFEEAKHQWDFPFDRFIIWRVKTGRDSTTLHFTPLSEVL